MKLVIDGVEVQARQGSSILDAAEEAGIYIPHLCKHPDLEAMGGCRLCSVELNGSGKVVPACLTPVEENLVVDSKSPAAVKVRNTALELILADHPTECGDCPKYGRCELQSIYQCLGVTPERRKHRHQPVADNASNPLILHRMTRCILCGRCVRACRELRGVKVLDFQRKDGRIRIGTDGGKSLAEAGCRFCGACIEVCPTGSILDQLYLLPSDQPYRKAIVPCRSACPAGVDVPKYLRYIKNNDPGNALATIREKVPFPHTLGLICTHRCESKCKRNELGGALSICRLKAFAAEHDNRAWVERGFRKPSSGKRVAVVGAGPAGLTAAYYLAKLGHEVTLLESHSEPGGQLRLGIPAYRLPPKVLDQEIRDILSAGIQLKCGVTVRSVEELSAYDAALIAVGTHRGVRLPIDGASLPGVVLNTEFLRQIRTGALTAVPERVAVLGGGSVAFDCARSAIRLGAQQVHVICLEEEGKMTADPAEISEGREEGVHVHPGRSFVRITGRDRAEGVEVLQVLSFEFDEQHRAVIQTKPGSEETISADLVIFAVGQRPDIGADFGLQQDRGGKICVDSKGITNCPGVFSCGDVVTGTRSVIEAIAAGRSAASEIDCYLGGSGEIDELLTSCADGKQAYLGQQKGFAELTRMEDQVVAPEVRKTTFEPVEQPVQLQCAVSEASRCLQCDLRLEITRPKTWSDFQ